MKPTAILVTLLSVILMSRALPAQEPQASPKPQLTLRVPLDDGSSRELTVYPIRMVIDAILDAQRDPDLDPAEERGSASGTIARSLRDAIATFADPPFVDGEEVQALGREHLAIVARPEQHAWIHRFLERQKATADVVAFIEVQVLTMTEESFEALEIDERPTVLAAKPGAAFLERVRAASNEPDSGLDLLQAPKLASLSMQRAQISAINQTAYVKDFKVEKVDGAFIADPEVDVIQDGIVLDGSFVVVDDDILGLSWHLRVSDLERPIPRAELDLGLGAPVTIQLPNVAVAEFDAEVQLGRDELAVLPGPELRGRRVVFVMGAHAIRDLDRKDTGKGR